MSSSMDADTASPRTPHGSSRLRIALTRASSEAGSALADYLAGSVGERIIGLDAQPGGTTQVDWRPGVLEDPSVVRALADVDVLVHLAWEPDLSLALAEQPAARRARQLAQARTLTTAAAAAGVPHLVVVTSAMVFGARADNPVPLPEDSPLRAQEPEGLVADLVAVEAELDGVTRRHPALRVTILRPAAMVGPGVDTMITRHFEAPRLLTLRGTTPAWKFCHLQDLASALITIAHRNDLPDQLTVSAPGTLSQAQVEELSGMRRIELAEATAHAAADRLHKLGVVPVPASDLAFVSHPWAAEPVRLTSHGWLPAHDNVACLATLLETVRGHHAVMARRLGSRDAAAAAAAGAASAAVAALATAALMRRRRTRD